MDIGKILFTLRCVKHKQFDCSLQVNSKSIKKTISCNIKVPVTISASGLSFMTDIAMVTVQTMLSVF